MLTRTAILTIAAAASPALATIETINTNALPSTQGWSFVTAGVTRTEAATASVSGGLLTFNTMGSGNQPSGSSIRYTKTISPDWAQSWYIQADVRLNAFESFSNFHGVYFGSSPIWVGISPSRLTFPDLSFVSYTPGTSFHSYRFEVQTNDAWTFYVDNAPVKSGVTNAGSTTLALVLGDGTGGSNGSATYASYEFGQPIPAPAPALAIPLAALALTRRRRA